MRFAISPFRVLIADNDPDNIKTVENSFSNNELNVEVSSVADGKALINFLSGKNKHDHQDLPQLILLDLDIPDKNAFEALREIKEDIQLRKIPVVILSTSNAHADVETAYELGANCYVEKPSTLEKWNKTIGELGKFWIQCATLSAVK